MKVVKKIVTLKKGKDEKRVKENTFAFFSFVRTWLFSCKINSTRD